jgi:hypothetical protein
LALGDQNRISIFFIRVNIWRDKWITKRLNYFIC